MRPFLLFRLEKEIFSSLLSVQEGFLCLMAVVPEMVG